MENREVVNQTTAFPMFQGNVMMTAKVALTPHTSDLFQLWKPSQCHLSSSLWPQRKNNWGFGRHCLINSIPHHIKALGNSGSANETSVSFTLFSCLQSSNPCAHVILAIKSPWFQTGWPLSRCRMIKTIGPLSKQVASCCECKNKKDIEGYQMVRDPCNLHIWCFRRIVSSRSAWIRWSDLFHRNKLMNKRSNLSRFFLSNRLSLCG